MIEPADLNATLDVVRRQRPDSRVRHRVELFGVVGSLARGEASLESDVDILVNFLPGATLFKISAAAICLEEALGRPVDLIDAKMLEPEVRRRMQADLVLA